MKSGRDEEGPLKKKLKSKKTKRAAKSRKIGLWKRHRSKLISSVLALFVVSAIAYIVHHRGQLSLYLRLNDIPVPALYGPSADEGA